MRRTGNQPEFEGLDEPERFLHLRSRVQRIMADNETQAQQIERLRKQVEDFTTREAALRERADREEEARTRYETQINALPRNAKQYMHPLLTVPESAILIPTSNFEIKPNF